MFHRTSMLHIVVR